MLSNLESHLPASACILEPHNGSISNPWKQKTLRFFSPLKKALFKAFYPLEKPWKNLNENLNGFKGWMHSSFHSSLFKFSIAMEWAKSTIKSWINLNELEKTWMKTWKVERLKAFKFIQVYSRFQHRWIGPKTHSSLEKSWILLNKLEWTWMVERI